MIIWYILQFWWESFHRWFWLKVPDRFYSWWYIKVRKTHYIMFGHIEYYRVGDIITSSTGYSYKILNIKDNGAMCKSSSKPLLEKQRRGRSKRKKCAICKSYFTPLVNEGEGAHICKQCIKEVSHDGDHN